MATRRTALLLMLALGGALLLPGLGSMNAIETTDARYLEISREMYTSGDYVVPRIAGVPHLDKPPVTYWAGSLGFATFGVTPFGGRIVQQVAVLATCVLIVAYGSRLLPLAWAWLGGAMFLTSALVYGSSRGLSTDFFQLFFVTAAMLLLFEGSSGARRASRVLGAGALLGASMLTKGPIGLMVVTAVFVPFLALERGRSRLPLGPVALALLLVVAIGLPWWLLLDRGGLIDVHGLLVREVVERAEGGGAGHPKGPFYYAGVWPTSLLPWTPLVALALWRLARTREGDDPRLDRFLLLWSVVPPLLFSLFATKGPNYILPAFPGTALAVARAGATGRLDDRWGLRAALASVVATFVIAAAVGAILLRPAWTFAVLGSELLVDRLVHPRLAGAALLVIGAGGALTAALGVRRGALRAALAALAVACAACFSLGFRTVAPALPSHREVAEVVASVPGARLVQHGIFSAGALFHGVGVERNYVALIGPLCEGPDGRRILSRVCLRAEDTLALMRSAPPTFCLVKQSDERWLEKKTGAVPVLHFEKHVLLANAAALRALRASGGPPGVDVSREGAPPRR